MSKLISIISIYALLLSIIYLFGFWNQFNINFLEYVSINEVILLSLKSLIISFSGFLLGVLINQLYMTKVLPYGEGRDTPEGKFLHKWWRLLILIPLLASIYIFIESNEPRFLLLILSVVFGVWIANRDFLAEYLSQHISISGRFNIVFISIQMLFFAYPFGTSAAETIIKKKEETVTVEINDHKYTYIGKLGDSLFVYTDMKETLQITPIPKEIKYIKSSSILKKEEDTNK